VVQEAGHSPLLRRIIMCEASPPFHLYLTHVFLLVLDVALMFTLFYVMYYIIVVSLPFPCLLIDTLFNLIHSEQFLFLLLPALSCDCSDMCISF
jgi:hypothetical protein